MERNEQKSEKSKAISIPNTDAVAAAATGVFKVIGSGAMKGLADVSGFNIDMPRKVRGNNLMGYFQNKRTKWAKNLYQTAKDCLHRIQKDKHASVLWNACRNPKKQLEIQRFNNEHGDRYLRPMREYLSFMEDKFMVTAKVENKNRFALELMSALEMCVRMGKSDTTGKVGEIGSRPMLEMDVLRVFLECGIDLHMKAAVESVDSAGVPNGIFKTKKEGLLFLDIVLMKYEVEPKVRLLHMASIVAAHMVPFVVLECLENSDLQPSAMMELCEEIACSSQYPMSACLEVSGRLRKMAASNKHRLHMKEFVECAEQFTASAVNMLNEPDQDIVAALILEERDPLGRTPIELALLSQDIQFMSSSRVTRISNTLWAQPYFMRDNSFTAEDLTIGNLLKTMLLSPNDFFKLPAARFLLESLSFLYFLVLYNVIIFHHIEVNDPFPFNNTETLFYFSVAANLFTEIMQILYEGYTAYIASGWNKMDIVINGTFVATFYLRYSSSATFRVGDASAQTVYAILMSSSAVLVYIRISFVFAVHYHLGPMLRMIQKMKNDIITFAQFSAIIVFGFALAFYNQLSTVDVMGFQDPGHSVLSMYRAFVGDFDYDAFEGVDVYSRTFLQILLSVFLGIGLIVLFNLLIAMMATTYDQMQEQSTAEYVYGRNETIWNMDKQHNTLPAPLNAIVFALSVVVEGFTCCGQLCCRGTRVGLHQRRVKPENLKSFKEKAGKHGMLKGFICANCHHANVNLLRQDMYEHIQKLLDKHDEDGNVPDWQHFVGKNLDICVKCFRARWGVKGEILLRRERLSFLVFLFALYLPIFLLFGMPTLITSLKKRALKIVEKRAQKKKEKRLQKYMQSEKLDRVVPKKASWARENLSKPVSELPDVHEDVREIYTMAKKRWGNLSALDKMRAQESDIDQDWYMNDVEAVKFQISEDRALLLDSGAISEESQLQERGASPDPGPSSSPSFSLRKLGGGMARSDSLQSLQQFDPSRDTPDLGSGHPVHFSQNPMGSANARGRSGRLSPIVRPMPSHPEGEEGPGGSQEAR